MASLRVGMLSKFDSFVHFLVLCIDCLVIPIKSLRGRNRLDADIVCGGILVVVEGSMSTKGISRK